MKTQAYSLFILLMIFWGTHSLFAQTYQLSGRVVDAQTQQALLGANLQLNSGEGQSTKQSGEFRFEGLAPLNYTLKVSYVGYQTQTLSINLEKNQELIIKLKPDNLLTDEVVIKATRATDKSAIAYTNLNAEEIEAQNFGQDLPILLNFTPSVVTTSDAGAGVGYTGIRIRGSDPTRVNVTINGIPLNDAESQGVFWVNMPDFASSLESVQIQRGVGTSTNGAAAFGASLNLQTNQLKPEPYLELDNSVGSFNTRKHSLLLGSGLIKDRFTIDARLSQIQSDGFIDRAFSDLRSFYLSFGYYGKRSLLRANVFSGAEQTFQAWYGVPEARLRGDLEGMQAFADRNGLNEAQRQNLFNADSRRYNSQLYDNEIDNYQQDHYQLFYNYDLGSNWQLNTALHYTRGRGYFEQYRYEDAFADYGFEDVQIGSETITNSDLIRQRWLDNHFYGTVFSLNYEGEKIQFNVGGGWNRYEGKHFGEIIWAEFAPNIPIGSRYYDNDATKTDANLYAKAFYQFTPRLNAFIDLQVRQVRYDFLGLAIDDLLGSREVNQSVTLPFFNPKVGLTYDLSEQAAIYASFSVANKEPNRDDFTQSTSDSRPEPETLYDLELGYRYQSANLAFRANYYYMHYYNQLILTGAVNDVGAYNRSNVRDSYRMGIELEAAWQINEKLSLNLNATFSQNKVQNFREAIDFFGSPSDLVQLEAEGYTLEAETGQLTRFFESSDLAFSPNIIAGGQITYQAFEGFEIAWLSKYVGEQYLDNTSSSERRLEAFFTNDLRFTYQLSPNFMKNVSLSLLVNNLFAEAYESNGYTYGYFVGAERISENFYYPQAGRNYLLALRLKF